ncbi:T7SS effector LXG polymorphic toxin [Peribacillus sp. SCS-37]|uniref:T7SS effector LXG polymorphic toxin n=1 Tax=Paraperibacillus esterisolvens TaxID=3115296 RepID=UPI0039068B9A
MKIMHVKALIAELDVTNQSINSAQNQIRQIYEDVKKLYSLEDEFQGNGAKAIKSFYEYSHAPFLKAFDLFLIKFRRALAGIADEYPVVEPKEEGFITEEFLSGDVTEGLTKIKNKTMELTDEMNDLIQSVQDIVSLPEINDDKVIEGTNSSKARVEKTLENLYTFDSEQLKNLLEIEEEVKVLIRYVNDLSTMFESGKITVNTFKSQQIEKNENFKKMNQNLETIEWSSIRLGSDADIFLDATTPFSSYSNTFGTLTEFAGVTEAAYNVKKHGVKIEFHKGSWIVKNGHRIGIKDGKYPKSYIESQVKRGNIPNVAKYVRASSAVKESFKGKLGYVGIAFTVGENMYGNIRANAPTSKIVGDAIVDVGVGAVSLTSGTALAALLIAGGGTLAAAAGIGAVASFGLGYVLEGIKYGKSEKSISDSLKDGVESGVETIAGWLK